MSKIFEDFHSKLEADEVMLKIKPKLEDAKVLLIDAIIKAIERMRILMYIDSKGEAGDNGDKERAANEIPLLVYSLTESLYKELAIRIMDEMDENWQKRAVKHVLDDIIKDIMEKSTDTPEYPTDCSTIHNTRH